MYEFFEHTADLGLRVRAATLDELFTDAARGLMGMIAEGLPSHPDAPRRTLEIAADRLDWLLCDWLGELLWLTESEGVLFADFSVQVEPQACRLRADMSSVPFDPETDDPLHEVKAITYHGLRVERTADGWLAEVIADI